MYPASRMSTGYEWRSRLLCHEFGWDYGYIVAGTSSIKKVGKFTYAYMFALYQHSSCRYELHTISARYLGSFPNVLHWFTKMGICRGERNVM